MPIITLRRGHRLGGFASCLLSSLVWLGFCWSACFFSAAAVDSQGSSSTIGGELVEWLRKQPGSFFHPGLEVRVSDNNDNNKGGHHRHGIYATQPIRKGQLLMEIPNQLLMRPGPPQVGERVIGYFTLENGDDDDDDDDTTDDDDEVEDGSSTTKEVLPYPGVVTSLTTSENGTLLYSMICDHDANETFNMTIDMISHEGTPINCATVRLLAKEMKSVESLEGGSSSSSSWGPYVRYLRSLLDQDPPERPLPSSWSEAGQEWLGEVLGHYLEDYGGDAYLPPQSAFGWVEMDWQGRCGGLDDPVEHDAYMLVRQRSYEEVLVPIFDILSHHNGRLLNTVSTSVSLAAAATITNDTSQPRSVQVHASRDIRAGEELHTTFNFCTDCAESRDAGYGTPELLRDYGFVEEDPRRFVFHDQGVSFDIDYVVDVRGEPTDMLAVNWTCPDCAPDETSLPFLEAQLQRLQDLAETDFESPSRPPPNVPEHEWRVICEYLDALIVGMRHAVEQAKREVAALAETRCTDDSSGNGELCSIASDRYPQLDPEEEDWSEARTSTCNAKTEFSYDEWVNVMSWTTSDERRLAVDMNPTMDNDVCYSVDSQVQMCSSYRPHYHELMVHYPAQFVPSVRQVLVVGSGCRTPMILHEVLKYPALQRVVLLDNDPTSVREAYRYFGVQPHFDDPRVDWWFGDIFRSLRSLLSSSTTVGSFDVVLLDLSEADYSSRWEIGEDSDDVKSVVLEALSLLMTPIDSILVQNEMLHFGDQTKVFREALHFHAYGIPVVCSKSFSVASNGVNFLRGPTHLHEVTSPYLHREGSPDSRYSIMRDYQKNTTNPSVCERYRISPLSTSFLLSRMGPKAEAESARIAGSLMIFDAEGLDASLVSPEAGLALLARAIKGSGLSILSTLSSPLGDDFFSVVVICQQGYVAARFWPTPHRYAALDLHFWTDIETQDAVRASILKTLGRSGYDHQDAPVSSFRVVTSGVAAGSHVEQRRLDQKRSSVLKSMCGSSSSKERLRRKAQAAPNIDSLLLFALVKNLELVKESNIVIAVICGQKSEECKTVSHLERSSLVDRVVPLYTCHGISGGVEFAQDGPDRLFKCEKETLNYLRASLGASKIRAIVLDESTNYPMAQVVVRIFMNHLHQQNMLTDDMFVQAATSNREPWRKVFVDKFRAEIFDDDPVFGTVISYNVTGASTSFDIALMSSGNQLFPAEMALHVSREMQVSGLSITKDTSNLRSGSFLWVEDFEPTEIFRDFHYNNRDALKQWSAQLPLGLQTALQLEFEDSRGAMSASALEKTFHDALRKIGVHPTRFKAQPVGDGCLLVGLWSSGNSFLLWDGHSRIDVSLFVADVVSESKGESIDDGSASLADAFVDSMLIPDVFQSDRIDFPRGIHSALLHPKPEEKEVPIWG